MPEITVEVAGRSYRLGCGEGEEQHLLALAARVDGEAARLGQSLGQSLGQPGEGRLLLMSALMLADRLSETEAALQGTERRAVAAEQTARAAADEKSADDEAEIAAGLDALSERIESLAVRIEGG